MPELDATIIGQVQGTLMSMDIDNVLAGDVMFMGGHLVRRVNTTPRERTTRVNGNEFREWYGEMLNETGAYKYKTAAGQQVLILRPSTTQGTPAPPKRYDVLDHNDDVLESWGAWSLAAQRAREHGFRVRDNAPDDGGQPRIECRADPIE